MVRMAAVAHAFLYPLCNGFPSNVAKVENVAVVAVAIR
jgi:hypothetical protein